MKILKRWNLLILIVIAFILFVLSYTPYIFPAEPIPACNDAGWNCMLLGCGFIGTAVLDHQQIVPMEWETALAWNITFITLKETVDYVYAHNNGKNHWFWDNRRLPLSRHMGDMTCVALGGVVSYIVRDKRQVPIRFMAVIVHEKEVVLTTRVDISELVKLIRRQ